MKRRLIFLIPILLVVVSCKYDFILPVPEAPVTAGVSFATKVVPIFTTGNKCTSCHKAGGQSPDYTAEKAYSSIVPNLVNTSSPNQSLIYTLAGPSTSTHNWKKLSASEAAIILQWITEGSKNN
ncbi:MAG: hypothetical protein NTV75_11525 [Bacteroidia bacterium]|nr:hypothetical protein [Bacteroidia bacterium]